MTAIPPSQAQSAVGLPFVPVASFAMLYDKYSPALFGTLMKLVGDQERAEDLLHDAFIKIWTHIHRYNAEQGGLYNWLLTITHNVAMDELRSRKVSSEATSYIRERDSDQMYPAAYERLSKEQFYALLPTKYGQILELIYSHGLTYSEVSQELSLPVGTVKTRCRTGLQKLQHIFKQDIYHYRVS